MTEGWSPELRRCLLYIAFLDPKQAFGHNATQIHVVCFAVTPSVRSDEWTWQIYRNRFVPHLVFSKEVPSRHCFFSYHWHCYKEFQHPALLHANLVSLHLIIKLIFKNLSNSGMIASCPNSDWLRIKQNFWWPALMKHATVVVTYQELIYLNSLDAINQGRTTDKVALLCYLWSTYHPRSQIQNCIVFRSVENHRQWTTPRNNGDKDVALDQWRSIR